jgi:hypothetical protein
MKRAAAQAWMAFALRPTTVAGDVVGDEGQIGRLEATARGVSLYTRRRCVLAETLLMPLLYDGYYG